MNRVLITGGKGYIGKHLVNCLNTQYEVCAYSLSTQGIPDDLSHTSCIIHLSALVHQAKAKADKDYFDINTHQTLKLAEKAKASGVQHFIFFSTVAVYGVNGALNANAMPPLNESSHCSPKTAYGASKLEAENLLLKLASDDFLVSIIRPPIVYGPNCPGNMTKLKKLMASFKLLPLGNSLNKRSMINIANLVDFTQLIIDKKEAGIFIPQDDEKLSIQQISKSIAKGLGKKPILLPMPKVFLQILHRIKPQMIESLYGHLVFDSTQSNQRLNFKARVTAQQALEQV